MDRNQKELVKTYYHARGIAMQQRRGAYLPYEYTPYALDNKIIDLESLSIGEKNKIFNSNRTVREYIGPYIDEYNKNATGFLRLLLDYKQTGEIAPVVEFVKNSEFIKENDGNVTHDGYGKIALGIDKDVLLRELDLEYDYDHVQYSTQPQSDWDSDEGNYMHHYVGAGNNAKIEEIAKKLGANKSEIEDILNDEGGMMTYLNDNDMDQVVGTYLEEYSMARERAESSAAYEALETFPFEFADSYYNKINDSELNSDTAIDYFYENDPSEISTFDQFLSYVVDNNEVNEEHVRNAGYEHNDYEELQHEVRRQLDSILDDFEDHNSDYYQRVQGQQEVQDALVKNGFKLIPKADDESPFATREQKDKIINIMDWGNDDDGKNPKLELEIIYKADLDKGENVRTGWIFAKNLGKYVDQYEVPELRE